MEEEIKEEQKTQDVVEEEQGIETVEEETTEQAEEKSTEEANGSESPEKKDLTEQDKIDHAFKKKQHELKEEKQRVAELQKKYDEAQAKLAEATAVKRPDIPPLPDQFDTDFETKMALRDEAIIQQQKYDASVEAKKQMQIDQVNQVNNQRVEEIKTAQSNFRKRATDLGIDHTDLDKTESYVSTFISPENMGTAEYILKHENGPLIVQYLGTDPLALDTISKMAPIDAAVYIATNVVPKAVENKPKTPGAPPPVDTLESKGAPPKEHPALEGVHYE